MEKGVYSYRDYSMDLCHIYIERANEAKVYYLPIEFYRWLSDNHLEAFINTYELYQLPKHLPYLTKLNEREPVSRLATALADIKITEEHVKDAYFLYQFVYEFEFIFSRDSVEERFRKLVPKHRTLVEDALFARAIRVLYEKYVTDANRFRLYLHCGIQTYLLMTKEREM